MRGTLSDAPKASDCAQHCFWQGQGWTRLHLGEV